MPKPRLDPVDQIHAALDRLESSRPEPSARSMDVFIDFANLLADRAREVILPYWRKPIEVESKIEDDRPVPESPVTIADRAAEYAIRELIGERYPEHGIFGEELGSVGTDREWVWVLDPIDGTKSFITGKPLFGTLIALLHRGVPVIGVIDQCVLKERWVGVCCGKYCNTWFNNELVTTRGVDQLSEAMLYATTPHMFAPGVETERFGQIGGAVKRVLYGADCYAYGLVAAGFGADLVVEADLGLYDYCALVPVVTGAGGLLTDWNGEVLSLQRHEVSKGRVVASSNRALHEAALQILKDEASPDATISNTTNA